MRRAISSADLIGGGAIGLMLGGLVWVLPTLLVLVGLSGGASFSGVQLALRLIGLLLLALGVVGLHALQEGSYGGIGRAGFYTAFVSTIVHLLVLPIVVLLRPLATTTLAPLLALVALVSLVGSVGWLVGFLLLGVGTLRARVLPHWHGVLLIILALVLVVADAHGGFSDYAWPGLVLVALGYGLWMRRGEPAEHSSVR
jgi:hypothetical protein